MRNRRRRSLLQQRNKRGQGRRRGEPQAIRRDLQLETLEQRQLLAVGPQLFAIRPDQGPLLQPGDVLHEAPREFNLLFKGGADIDETTIPGNVRLVRSGHDGTFGDGNEVVVDLGYVGLNEPPPDPNNPLAAGATVNRSHIVMRPASSAVHNANRAQAALPDDWYRIEVIGRGASPLANNHAPPEPFNDGQNLFFEFQLDLGAQVIAVAPQPVSRATQQITITGGAPTGTFTLGFAGETTSPINVATANAAAIQNALINDISVIGQDDVRVAAAGAGRFNVTFRGQYAGEQVPSILVNDASVANGTVTLSRLNTLSQATDQVVVYFNDDLEPTQATNPMFYRLVDTGATAATGDDVTVLPTRVSYDSNDDTVVLTFSAPLPDGTYRLDVGVSDESNALREDAIVVGTLFNNTSFEYVGYLGDIGGVNNSAGDVDLYKINLPAGATITVTPTPDPGLVASMRILDRNGNSLTGGPTASPLMFNVPVGSAGDLFVEVTNTMGSGAFRLSMTVTGNAIPGSDANSSFATATPLGTLGIAGASHSAQIEAQSIPMPAYPGGEDEPGHRLIQAEQHIPTFGLGPFAPGPIPQQGFYFPDSVGPYPNFISETEKQVVREIYEIYGSVTGIQFRETTGGGTAIMKGDLKAAEPTDISGPGGVAGRGGPGLVVLDFADFPNSNNVFGSEFFNVMFHEIGHALGLAHSYDIPSVMGAANPGEPGAPNDVFPGDHDIVHLNRIFRPDSTDIDLYEFALAEPGYFTAEIVAERRAVTSMLDSVLTLFRENEDGTREVIARNDNYFSNDSFIGLDLEPGTYFIGVSSAGNVDYDPNIADSGFGGRTDGPYDLLLDIQPAPQSTLTDHDGSLLDGDADGLPGGQYQFWFESSRHTIFVDKANDQRANIVDGNGQLTGTPGNPATGPYDTISFAMRQAANRVIVPSNRAGMVTIADGDTLVVDDGINPPVTFEFDEAGSPGLTDPLNHVAISFNRSLDSAATVAAAIASTINTTFGTPLATPTDNMVSLAGISDIDLGGSAALLGAPNLVRVVGNGGLDGNIHTLNDNRPYLVGLDNSGVPLPDGQTVEVPQGVTAMFEAGALLKLRKGNIDAGTSSALLDRRGAAIQVLGTPDNQVYFRSLRNDTIGGNSDGVGPLPAPGDYGGIVFREDSDLEDAGIFLNYVNHANINNGGGKVFVGSNEEVFAPIHMVVSRPTVSFNAITNSADAAMSANPNSFDDAGGRIGPDIHGNFLSGSSINGLFVRIETEFGNPIEKLDVQARFDDDDIAHVITENLLINGAAGGPLNAQARTSGRLHVDPGVVVKLGEARIEMERGASNLIAEGTDQRLVIFTSLADDRYGGSGTFDTNANGLSQGLPGDWGGLMFNAVSSGSIDNALIAFGGGQVPIEGGFDNFNAIEVHQARLRLTNSTLQFNASGLAASGGNTARNGRSFNTNSVIHVSGAQPIVVNNTIQDNAGGVLNINANALQARNYRDYGRSTGTLQAFEQFADNEGPLVRLNRLDNNGMNAMTVRGEELTTQTTWDDTDIAHVLRNEITLINHHTFSGIRLKSSNTESLVVKLQDTSPTIQAGITASGELLEIDDRIGGMVHIIGTVGHPVVMTSLADDSVGAGFTPEGSAVLDTNGDGLLGVDAGARVPQPGDWRGILLDRFSNDRNVAVIDEAEIVFTAGIDTNFTPSLAQALGTLAPNEKSGDENSRYGFEVHGFISPDDPTDVDVYSFIARPGTEVWFDIDDTSPALDAVIELVNVSGTVLARSIDNNTVSGIGQIAHDNPLLIGDFYTTNFRDPSMRLLLPGTGSSGTYFIRVRSNPQPDNPINNLDGGLTSGAYQLQVRLRQVDEYPGSTVRSSEIAYADVGIAVRGLPAHSLIVGETAEIGGSNAGAPQELGNLLETDRAALTVAGRLDTENQRDFYDFLVEHRPGSIQSIGGVNDGGKTIAAVFDVDFADGAVRADSSLYVFDPAGNLLLIGRESNVEDDQGRPGVVPDTQALDRGSLGLNDPFIGPVHLPEGMTLQPNDEPFRYQLVVSSNSMLADPLDQYYRMTPFDPAFRLEPVNSITRVVEDHIGFSGYVSGDISLGATYIPPSDPEPLLDITDSLSLQAHVREFDLGDVVLFVASAGGDALWTVNPFQGGTVTRVTNDLAPGNTVETVQDIAIRTDGEFFGYRRRDTNPSQDQNDVPNLAGTIVRIDGGNGALTTVGNDNVPAGATTQQPNGNLPIPNIDELTFTDDVDAITFEIVDRTGAMFDPVYEALYSVREEGFAVGGASSFNSKLYRGDIEGASGSAVRTNAGFGLEGNIQPAGVTFAFDNQGFADANNNGTVTIQSRAPGVAGNGISVVITRAPGADAVTSANPVSGVITVRLDNTNNGTATIQELVDLINRDAIAGTMVTAAVTGGSGATTVVPGTTVMTLNGGNDGTDPLGPLQGFVTGMAYAGNQLYGVTSAGDLLRINDNTGRATRLITPLGVSFQGLSLGPQNVSEFDAAGNEIVSRYRNLLFAIDEGGTLFAFDTNGVLQPVFDSDGDDVPDATSIPTGLAEVRGLAFSPLDFNLWHPTFRRGQPDAAHGINPLFDNSRNPSSVEFNLQGRDTNTGEGGASFYFGFEAYDVDDNDGYTYIDYGPANAQYGIEANALGNGTFVQTDLSSNPAIGNNYNLPGGALGSLVTSDFSLEPYSFADKPTLYFNYFLQTENHPGSNVDTDGNNPFRDSARVFISRDDGANWELLTTNNSLRSTEQFTNNAELPTIWTDSSTEGLRFGNGIGNQQVQELFDSNNWRQARVDLSGYVGESNLTLRFDFSTAGAMNDPTLGLIDAGFGEFFAGDRSIRGQNNAFEGFYIDDIIIGFSERGEMASGNRAGGTDFFPLPQPPMDWEQAPEVLIGPYQVEVRRADDFAGLVAEDDAVVAIGTGALHPLNNHPFPTFDTNDRLEEGYTITAPPGNSLSDGMTFTIIGRTTRVFEFNSSGGVATGHVPVNFNAGMTDDEVAVAIRNAINTTPDFGVLAIVHTPTSNRVDLVDARNVTLGASAPTVTVNIAAATLIENDPNPATTVNVVLETPAPAGGANVTLSIIDSGSLIGLPSATFPGGATTVSVTVPAGATTLAVPVNLLLVDDALADGTQTVVVSATASGYTGVSDHMVVTDNEAPLLSFAASPASLGEGATAFGGLTVTRNTPTNHPLAVTFTSLDPSELRVGGGLVDEVEPNNSFTSAQDLDAAPWTLANSPNHGDQAGVNTSRFLPHVSIRGDGNGTFDYYSFTVANAGTIGIFDIDDSQGGLDAELFLYDAAGNLLNADDDSPTTAGAGGSVSFADPFIEHTFAAPGTYFIVVGAFNSFGTVGGPTGNTPSAGESYTLNVSISEHALSDDLFTIEIPAGQSSLVVPFSAVEDFLVDGDQSASLVASAPGFPSVTDTVTVVDSTQVESFTMVINAPTSIVEDGGFTTGTVTRSGDLSRPFVVDLTSHDTSEAIVPTTLTVPIGQTTATFTITAVDDGMVDGNQVVTITASRAGFSSQSDTVTVVDTDIPDTPMPDVFDDQGHDDHDHADEDPIFFPDETYLPVFPEGWLGGFYEPPAFDVASDHTPNILTVILDFVETSQGSETDGIGNTVLPFDVTGYGFLASEFSLVTNSVLAEVESSYLDMAKTDTFPLSPIPVGQQLAIEFEIGDVGTPPANGSNDYYYVLIGGDAGGNPCSGALGCASLSAIRSAAGVPGAAVGSVVGSVFSDTINGIGLPAPGNQLTSGNLGFTTYALAGTTAHEIGHALSLLHMNKAGVTTPNGFPPIMGTGAIDLPNVDRIGPREFSYSGMNAQAGNAVQMHMDQLVSAIGLHDSPTIADIAVSVAPTFSSVIREDDGLGATRLRIARANSTGDLDVTLSSSDPSEAIPQLTSFTIPDGDLFVDVDVTAIDDTISDGTQTVFFTATAAGFNSVITAIDVLDSPDDASDLRITATVVGANPVDEGDGAFASTLRIDRSDSVGVTNVAIVSSDPSEAAAVVMPNVTLGAGQTTTFVPLAAIDDFLLDGTQTAIFTPVTSGRTYAPIRDYLDVLDDELRELTVTLADPSITESDGPGATSGTVTIPGPLPFDLDVLVHSGDASEVLLRDPLTGATGQTITIRILAGDITADFLVDPVDEFTDDGTRTVAITAFAPDFAPGVTSLDVVGDSASAIQGYLRSGDANRYRDQGQVLLEKNTIVNSASWGIEVSPGQRDVGGNRTYPGAPINFAQLNSDRIAPGVVIQNNIIVASEAGGGIHISGEPNTPPNAVLPFARVTNNTVFGGSPPSTIAQSADVIFLQDTTLSMEPIIDEIVNQLLTMDTAMRAAGINVRYGAVRMPEGTTFGGSPDPAQVQDITDFATFSAPNAPYPSLANDTGGIRERGSEAVLEALNQFDPSSGATTFNYTPGSRIITVLISTENDDSVARQGEAIAALQARNAVFFGIIDPDNASEGGGTADQHYRPLANATGGQILDIADFQTNPDVFFDAFVQSLIGVIGGSQAVAGIVVDTNASPTILNNVVAGFQDGITIGAGSGSTVLGSNAFKDNTRNVVGAGLGSSPLVLQPSDPLFANAFRGNFYPADGSPIVDSSLNSLQDRNNYVNFKTQLGIAQSPIFAPERDVYGQLRVDSEEDPLGAGSSVFKDRGAVDKADDERPYAQLLIPLDNDVEGLDRDPTDTVVYRVDTFLEEFSILLGDGAGPNSPFQGTGINERTVDIPTETSDPNDPDSTVSQRAVRITANGRPLVEDVDYTLGYNANNNLLLLTPLSSLWEPNLVYEITLDNTLIQDQAGNFLRDNRPDGTTRFTIILGAFFQFDYGDAPDQYGTLLTSDGARHVLLPEAPLFFGRDVDAETDGQPTPAADGDDRDTQVLLATSPLTLVSEAPFQIRLPGGGAALTDGDSFTIDDGVNPLLQFTLDLNGDGVAAGIPIPYYAADPVSLIADRMVAAIQSEVDAGNLTGVVPANLGGDTIVVSGDPGLDVDFSGLTGFAISNRFPLRLQVPAAGIADQQIFEIHDGEGNVVIFEFEEASAIGLVTGDVAVPFTASDPATTIAASIGAAIQQAMDDGLLADFFLLVDGDQLRLAPREMTVDTTNSAGIAVTVDAAQRHTLQIPPAGVGQIVDGQTLTLTMLNGGIPVTRTYEFDDTSGMTGMPGLDDANNIPVEYDGTAYDAAAIATELFAAIDAELVAGTLVDFTASVAGDTLELLPLATTGDDEDGITIGKIFVPSEANITETAINIVASGPGLVDAWIDFNGNGQFDPEEQIFASQPVVAGLNEFVIDPSTLAVGVASGDSYARFRISAAGGLFPNSIGIGGEVEDHFVRILGNTAPVVANPVAPIAVQEDATDDTINLNNVFNDVDIANGNGDSLSLLFLNDMTAMTFQNLNGDDLVVATIAPDGTLTLNYVANANGQTEIFVKAIDHAGLERVHSFSVAVQAVNDPPEVSIASMAEQDITIMEGSTPRVLTGIVVNDVDEQETPAPNNTLRVTLSVPAGQGRLSINATGTSATITPPSGPSETITIEGTEAAIDTILGRGVTYQLPDSNFNEINNGGAVFVTIAADDLGRTGLLLAGQTDSDTITIHVTAVNDPPVVSLPGTPVTMNEADPPLNILGIAVDDFDEQESAAPNNVLQVTLSIPVGTGTLAVTPSGTAIVTPSPDNRSIVIRGVEADIDAILAAGVTYTLFDSDFNNTVNGGPVPLTILAEDLGSTGTGGPGQHQRVLNIDITPVNDAPIVTLPSGAADYFENSPPVAIDPAATITDVDSPNFGGGTFTVNITANQEPTDQIGIDINADGDNDATTGIHRVGLEVFFNIQKIGDIDPTLNGADGADLRINLTGQATLAATQALARAITYATSSDLPSELPRTVTFTVVDGDGTALGGADTGSATTTVNVTSVNDAPIVTLSGQTLVYEENAPATRVEPTASVVDPDSPNFNGGSLTVSIAGNPATEFLSIAGSGTPGVGIEVVGAQVRFDGAVIGNIDAADDGQDGSPLVVYFTTTATTPAVVQELVRAVAFYSADDNPLTPRVLTYVVNDGIDDSLAAMSTISITPVNDPPVIGLPSSPVSYLEDSPFMAIDPAATVTDPDSTNFAGGRLTVSFAAGGTTNDQLTILNTGTITTMVDQVRYDSGVGPIRIGTFSGGQDGSPLVVNIDSTAATLPAAAALLRAIAYYNDIGASTADRIVQFALVDGDGDADTGINTATIQFTGIDDPMVVELPGPGVQYLENDPATIIDGTAVVIDVDTFDFAGGSVTASFTAGGSSGDQLGIANVGGISVSGTDVAFDAGSGPQVFGTVSGGMNGADLVIALNNSGFASPTALQALARALTYANSSDNPSTVDRELTLTVFDGTTMTSDSASTTISVTPVNDEPVITLPSGPLDYNENAPATALDASATLADPDSPDLQGGSLTVAFTAGATTSDQLSILSTGGISTSGSNLLFDAGGGPALIGTFSGGQSGSSLTVNLTTAAATRQAVGALVRAIAFHNTSDDPLATPRSFTMTLVDGDGRALGGNDTGVVAGTVNVLPQNDAPVLTSVGGQTLPTVSEDNISTPVSVMTLVGGTITDLDSTNPQNANDPIGIAIIAATSSGTWQYSTNGGGSWNNITNAALSLNAALLLRGQDLLRFDGDDANGETATLTYRAWDQTGASNGQQGTLFDAASLGFGGGSPFSLNSDLASIVVTPVNDAPTVQNVGDPNAIPPMLVSAIDGGPPVTGNFVGNDVDNGETAQLIYRIISPPSAGQAYMDGTPGDLVGGPGDTQFTFAPGAGFRDLREGEIRRVTFTYRATDPTSATSNPGTVTVTVTGVNDAPEVADVTINASEDGPPRSRILTAFDAEGQTVVFELDNQVTLGACDITLNAANLLDNFTNNAGLLTFNPQNEFHGLAAGESCTLMITYTADDQTGLSTSTSIPATITVVVAGVNDVPVLSDDSYTTDEDTPITRDALNAMDIDVDVSDVLTVVAVGTDTVSVLGAAVNVLADGTFTYNPTVSPTLQALTETATPLEDTFRITVEDSQGARVTQMVTITVDGLNDAPTANPDFGATTEDRSFSDNLLVNDTDPDAGETAGLTVTAANLQSTMLADVTISSGGAYTYDPRFAPDLQALAVGETVIDTFTYTVRDQHFATSQGTVSITVTGVNDAPIARTDAAATTEDAMTTIDALANDDDVDNNDVLSVFSFNATSALGAVITQDTNGDFVYDPRNAAALQALRTNQTVEDTFTYRISDLQGARSTGTVTVTVTGVNDAPVAVGNQFSIDEDSLLTVSAAGVLANDMDVDNTNNELRVLQINGSTAAVGQLVTLPSGAQLRLNADGGMTYDPRTSAVLNSLQTGETATDLFTYRVGDGAAASASPATVTITISGRNDAPVARPEQYMTSEDAPLNVAAIGLLANDTDIDGDPLVVNAFTGTSTMGATLAVNADGSFSYNPVGVAALQGLAAGETANDTFAYTIRDGNGGTSMATATVTVSGVNDVPVARNDNHTVDEDSTLVVSGAGVLENDVDADASDVLNVVSAGATAGTQNTTPIMRPNGTFYFAFNSQLGAPVTVDTDGKFSFDPTQVPVFQQLGIGQTLVDRFVYTAGDSASPQATSLATVTITVEGRNDAPIVVDDQYTVAEDGQLIVSSADGVLNNPVTGDRDPEGTPLSASLVDGPRNGRLSFTPAGGFTYTPNKDFNGDDTFTYRARDGVANSVPATVTITVTPVNDPPVAVADEYTVDQDTSLTIPAPGVLANDTDVDGETLTAQRITNPARGVLSFNANGSFTYTPNAGFFGMDSFQYDAVDASGSRSRATVTIEVVNTHIWQNPVNRLDVNADGFVTAQDALIVINYLNNPDNPTQIPDDAQPGPPYRDVSGDDMVTPQADVIPILNFLNNQAAGGEGEGAIQTRLSDGEAVNPALVAQFALPRDTAPLAGQIPYAIGRRASSGMPVASGTDNNMIDFALYGSSDHTTHVTDAAADGRHPESTGPATEFDDLLDSIADDVHDVWGRDSRGG